MGLFDFFTKETEGNNKKPSKNRSATFTNRKLNDAAVSSNNADNVAVRVFKPTSFDDVCQIIDFLLLNKPAVVNMEAVKDETIQRVMDILSGACYALHGDISEISQNIYLISPDGQVM